jgi:dimethylargininase
MLAFVREVSPALAKCELTLLERAAIDVSQAQHQHAEYCDALRSLGCQLQWLRSLPEHADGVFVEDTAVVLPTLAIVTRPGIASRRGETASVAEALARHVRVARLTESACLDGGDVLQIGRRFFVGSSGRTNSQGIAELARALSALDYSVQAVPLTGCLHLKSACSFIPPDILVANPSWVNPSLFGPHRLVAVDESEPYGANSLTVKGTTLVSTAYPRTHDRLRAAAVVTRALDVSELHKAEAALTCMSLLLDSL